jgi:serine phosphatase RsbU (regulator of sigma subunit)
MEDMAYTAQSVAVPGGSRLFVPCDGCYEIRNTTGDMADYAAFEAVTRSSAGSANALGDLENWALEMRGTSALDDDFSIIQIQFPE